MTYCYSTHRNSPSRFLIFPDDVNCTMDSFNPHVGSLTSDDQSCQSAWLRVAGGTHGWGTGVHHLRGGATLNLLALWGDHFSIWFQKKNNVNEIE